MAAKKAQLEEEECEQVRQVEEARARAEEEARRQEEERRVWEEEDRLAVEQDPREEGGHSRERAPWRRLFLLLSDSARSLEEEERVEGPSLDKGKGRAPALEEVWGEVTGVVCDLCDKKGIPCRWGKVRGEYSLPFFFLLLLISVYRRQPMFGLAWAVNKPGQSVKSEVQGPSHGNGQGRRRVRRRGPAGRCR